VTFDSQLVIEPLNRDHNRATFHCGNDPLNSYLKQQATQDINRHVSRIFIARRPRNKTTILGYYTLSTLSIDLSDLPEKVARKLPRHPIPAALIGRLAVDLSMQGHGVGEMLLANALKRTLAVAEEIGI
jgi:GNAT superfamily N-acetyltransferase